MSKKVQVPVVFKTTTGIMLAQRKLDPPVRVRDIQRALGAAQRRDPNHELVVLVGGRRWTADELAELGRRLGSKALMPLDGEPGRDIEDHEDRADEQTEPENDPETSDSDAEPSDGEAPTSDDPEPAQASDSEADGEPAGDNDERTEPEGDRDNIEDRAHKQTEPERDTDNPETSNGEPDGTQAPAENGDDGAEPTSDELDAEGDDDQEANTSKGDKGEDALSRILNELDAELDPEPSQEAHSHPAEHRLRQGWHADRSLVRQVSALLQRWMSDGEQHDGPRVDWERGISRLLTSRDPRTVRREEIGTPRLAVLIDDSPSCGKFVTKAAPLAAALMRLGNAEAVMVHANGYDADVWTRGRLVRKVRELSPDMPELRNITHVLILGDWDAAELYRAIAATREVIWLDGWRARLMGEPFDATDRVRERWGDRDARRVRYVAGCGKPAHWVEALELAIE